MIEGSYHLNNRFTLRGLGMGFISKQDRFEVGDYEVDGDASIGGMAILADYFPWTNGWRISGGQFISNTEINGTFGNITIDTDGTIGFENGINPMISMGYIHNFSTWSLSGETGLILGKLRATTDHTEAMALPQIVDLNDNLDDLPGYPYIAVTTSFRF